LLLYERQTGNGSTEVPYIELSTFALPCLGTHNGGPFPIHVEPDFLQLKHGISIDAKTDKFSYRGNVENENLTSGFKTRIALAGQFTSRTTATLKLTVDYGSCGTQHFKLRH
jgi:hypothetical protein